MITKKERQIIFNYMDAVCHKATLGSTDIAGQVTTPDGETMTTVEANHRYGQALNVADDAMREMLLRGK